MVSLTVGYVSGFIALAIFIFSFLLPNLIALLMASIVERERSAVTWSVLGKQLHKSFWSILLNADSTSGEVPRSVWLLGWLETICMVVVAIAGVVTPLGLSSEVSLDASPQQVPFQYMSDLGPMGYGTPTRDLEGFLSRICVGGCPFTDTPLPTTGNPNAVSYQSKNANYDVRLPYITADVFGSVHDELPTTVASSLEMEWRQFAYAQKDHYNDNKTFQVGMARFLTSLALDDSVQAVEGLVVDTANGGVALRNHTVPANQEYGAEWTEDLLFITPESVCVDTNLTLDFEISSIGTFDNNSYSNLVNISITDRGGFVNLNTTYPARAAYDGQKDADLWFRAYKAAWWNNAMSMLYYNVTNPKDTQHAKAFQYLNSTMDQRFWLGSGYNGLAVVDALSTSSLYGRYVKDTGFYSLLNNSYTSFNTTYYGDPRGRYANPFNITSGNFSNAGLFCAGAGGADLANISNLAVSCGLVYGAATRQDGKQSLILEPGSQWTQRIYSCATAAKAEIKHVQFQWNSTADGDGLKRLKIRNVTAITYGSDSPPPWWAVENLQHKLSEISPLWGPVSASMARRYASSTSFDFVQSPRLYVPGYTGFGLGISSLGIANQDNLAAPVAITNALSSAYNVDKESQYSGANSMAVLAKWQRLSHTPDTAAQILNLIFTDSLANIVLGSRSWLSTERMPSNTQPARGNNSSGLLSRQNVNSSPYSSQTVIPSVPVYVYRSRITYNWLYSIPAFLAIALFMIIFGMTAILTLLGRIAGPRKISDYLKRTSAGRLMVLIDESRPRPQIVPSGALGSSSEKTGRNGTTDKSSMLLSTNEWAKGPGQRILNLDATTGQHASTNYETTDQESGTGVNERASNALQTSTTKPRGGYKAVPQVLVEPAG